MLYHTTFHVEAKSRGEWLSRPLRFYICFEVIDECKDIWDQPPIQSALLRHKIKQRIGKKLDCEEIAFYDIRTQGEEFCDDLEAYDRTWRCKIQGGCMLSDLQWFTITIERKSPE